MFCARQIITGVNIKHLFITLAAAIYHPRCGNKPYYGEPAINVAADKATLWSVYPARLQSALLTGWRRNRSYVAVTNCLSNRIQTLAAKRYSA